MENFTQEFKLKKLSHVTIIQIENGIRKNLLFMVQTLRIWLKKLISHMVIVLVMLMSSYLKVSRMLNSVKEKMKISGTNTICGSLILIVMEILNSN